MAETPSNPKKQSVRRAFVVAAAALLIGACGSSSEAVAADPRPVVAPADTTSVDTTETDPSAADQTELDGDEPAPVAAPETTTSAPPTTSSPPALAETVEPTIETPEAVGASDDEQLGLMVVTAPDDPLNIRSGPGPEYPIVGELEHRTTGIDSSHSVEVELDVFWNLVSTGGDELGWVHAGFLVTPSATASCVAPVVTATDVNLVLSAQSDLDFDQLIDTVEVYTGVGLTGTANQWVEVQFGNGGSAFGLAADATSVGHFPSVMEMRITRLNYLPGGSATQEIAITTAQGASHSGWTVLGFDDCTFIQTRLDDSPFGFSLGASAIASSAGCGYDVHGETGFTTTVIDFNAETWSQTYYELRGTEWTEYSTNTGTTGQLPTQDGWDSCGGVTA